MMARETSVGSAFHLVMTDWAQSISESASASYERMLGLEAVRSRVLQLLPNPEITPRLQAALDLLRRQALLSQLQRRRCEALSAARLAPEQQEQLACELLLSHQRAVARLMSGWPALDCRELEALPLLLMRQRLDLETDEQLEGLRLALNFKDEGAEGPVQAHAII